MKQQLAMLSIFALTAFAIAEVGWADESVATPKGLLKTILKLSKAKDYDNLLV